MNSSSIPNDRGGAAEIPWMKSLSTCINHLRGEGYREDFQVSKNGLHTFNEAKNFAPDQVRVVNFYRFEGESDPADNSILYAIETNDGTKGTLVDAYGLYADPVVDKFILQVNEIQKQVKS